MKRTLACLTLLVACDAAPGPTTSSATAATASAAPSTTASTIASAVPEAPKSPLHVVLQSKGALTLAGLVDGVWISEGPGKRVAQAKAGAPLTSAPAPEGLPTEGASILHVSGLLDHVWVTLALDKPADGSMAKTPLYRLGEKAFRRIDENWSPLVAIWSKNRELAVWQSSGQLTSKVPVGAVRTPTDRPSGDLDDTRCPFNLRLGSLAALPTGEVFLLGSCSTTGAKSSRSVVVQWPVERPPTDPPAERDTETAADEPAADGVLGHVMVLPGPERKLSAAWMVARSATNVLVAGVDGEAEPHKSYLWRFDGSAWTPLELPNAEAVRGVAETTAGVVWVATEHSIWTKEGKATWQPVPLPKPFANFETIVATDDTVWIAGQQSSGETTVLSTHPTPAITW